MEDSYSHKYKYPALDTLQLEPLCALKEGLVSKCPINELIELLQAACYPLIAHHQHQYDSSRHLDQFFSPVICFLVLFSVQEQGGFAESEDITQYVAHVMFGARGVISLEVKDMAKRLGIGMSEWVSIISNVFVIENLMIFRCCTTTMYLHYYQLYVWMKLMLLVFPVPTRGGKSLVTRAILYGWMI